MNKTVSLSFNIDFVFSSIYSEQFEICLAFYKLEEKKEKNFGIKVVQCTLYMKVYCTMYTVQECLLYIIHCTGMCNVQCTLYRYVYCTMYTVQKCILYNVHCTGMYIVRCKLYRNVYCLLCNLNIFNFAKLN